VKYDLTSADCAPLPQTYNSEERYLGYREADLAKPYAKYFQTNTIPENTGNKRGHGSAGRTGLKMGQSC
jgi:hypothetical protein